MVALTTTTSAHTREESLNLVVPPISRVSLFSVSSPLLSAIQKDYNRCRGRRIHLLIVAYKHAFNMIRHLPFPYVLLVLAFAVQGFNAEPIASHGMHIVMDKGEKSSLLRREKYVWS